MALVAILLAIALVLRIIGLNEGLWYDEIATLVHHVRLPAREIIGHYNLNNHILYSLLAHFSIGWFGESAWSIRLPAVVFGVVTIPAAYYLGRQLASRYEAFLATAFSKIIPISSFGIYAATIIPVNFILVITAFPPILMWWE